MSYTVSDGNVKIIINKAQYDALVDSTVAEEEVARYSKILKQLQKPRKISISLPKLDITAEFSVGYESAGDGYLGMGLIKVYSTSGNKYFNAYLKENQPSYQDDDTSLCSKLYNLAEKSKEYRDYFKEMNAFEEQTPEGVMRILGWK